MDDIFHKIKRWHVLGLVGCICLLSAGLVMAEVFAPKPPSKSSVTSVEFVKVHADGRLAAIPLPPNKPQNMGTMSGIDGVAHKKGSAFASSDRQAGLYHDIFTLQNAGKMQAADGKIKKLKSDILMGHVLAERYLHPTAYRADYAELQDWMRQYADHPQAARIYRLALLKKPKNAAELHSPKPQSKISGNLGAVSKRGKLYQTTARRNESQEVKVAHFKKDIRRHLKRNEPTMALSILNSDYTVKFLDDVEYDRLRAEIASGYLFVSKLDQALSLADRSLTRSGQKVPLAGWVKGLVQWQYGRYTSAARAFESAASSAYSSGWMVSAAGYWASRAHMRGGNVQQVSGWLELAASYPRTFYGLIATRALGHKTEFDWGVPKLTRDHIKQIEQTKYGRRATALIKAGQVSLAEAELRNIDIKNSARKKIALMAYAHHFKLPALSMQLGNAMKNKKGGLYDAALYPDTAWTPPSGYKVDRALIHAIVRQESRFRSNAQNPSGATGLMQLMPKTANYVAGADIYHQAGGQHQLKDPVTNLELGQAYIKDLLNHSAVGQDLLSLAIAYNAGPGNLTKWKRERAHMQDPLLFIETIPYHETRAFVERVLANYWIYRMRFNQDTPSLDAVAQGKWARYAGRGVVIQRVATVVD